MVNKNIHSQNSPPNVDATSMIIISIFNTFCCFPPLGIIALYLAATAGSQTTQIAAESRLKSAKLINFIAIAIGLIIAIPIFILLIITVLLPISFIHLTV